MKNKIFFIFFILFFYIYLNQIYKDYYLYYNLPFGKDDADNYIGLFKNADIVHYFFTRSILLFGENFKLNLSLILPVIFGIITPIILFLFYNTIDRKNSINLVYFTILNTYFLFYGYIIAIWTQYISILFYIISLIFLYKNIKYIKLFYLFSLLSILFHPYSIFVYLLMFICFLYDKHIEMSIFLVAFTIFLMCNIPPHSLIEYTIFSSRIDEPTLYHMFYIFINPIIIIFLFLGYDKYYLGKFISRFAVILYMIGLIGHNSRILIYSIPFIIFYSYKGFKKYITNKYLIVFIWIISIIFFFHLQNYFIQQLINTMNIRGLSDIGIKTIFNVK